MFICKFCEKEYESLLSLSKHLVNNHKYQGGLLQYYVDYENFKIPKCKYCDKEAKYYNGLIFRKTCGDKRCIIKSCEDRKIDNKTKSKISESMFKVHKEGNHPGWSFINKDSNRRSYPEKWFIKNVLEKHKLYSKYVIKEKFPFHKYFLDFAIIDLKVDIEIDGQQHFIDEKSIEHDRKRDEFLLKNDWKVYRITWLELKNSPKIIDNLLNWLNDGDKYRKYNVEEVLKLLKKRNVSKKQYISNRRNNYNENSKKLVLKIEKSDIDFSKQGWVKKVSKLLNISENKGGWWMKRNMIDFYIEKCWKRKSSRSSTD